jgi:hypothetical protein
LSAHCDKRGENIINDERDDDDFGFGNNIFANDDALTRGLFGTNISYSLEDLMVFRNLNSLMNGTKRP